MLPTTDQMMFCIVTADGIVDGANGLAIGNTVQEAWGRALEPCADWTIEKAKRRGCAVSQCAIMLINSPFPETNANG